MNVQNVLQAEKDEIMKLVPRDIKNRFGTIGFCKHGNYIGPILELNPYDVEPGKLRDEWVDMCIKAKDQNSLDSIKSLVYWYGYFDELKEAYSFVYPSKLMTYETGMNRIERKVSFLNKRKKEGKAVVPLFDQGLLKGMEEMKEDLKKMPSKRCGYVGRYWEEDNDSDYDNEEDYNDEQGDGVNNSGDEEEYNDEQDDGVNYSGDDEEEYNDEEDDVRIQGTSGKRKRGGGTEVHVKEGTRRSPKKKKETALLKEQNKKHREEIVTLKAKNKKAAQALRNSAQMLLNAAHALEAANLSYIV